MNNYWLKIGLGLLIVSIPFLVAALRKKIPWLFFWSWTFTSVFSTLTFLLVQNAIEKNLSNQTKLIVSVTLGVMFASLGAYMRTIQSPNIQRMGWLFVIFGLAFVVLSI